MIVYADADLIDTPVELSPTGDDDARFHQHVLERPMPEGTSYAAVFDKITEGTYTLWLHGEPRVRDFKITGGAGQWTGVTHWGHHADAVGERLVRSSRRRRKRRGGTAMRDR